MKEYGVMSVYHHSLLTQIEVRVHLYTLAILSVRKEC